MKCPNFCVKFLKYQSSALCKRDAIEKKYRLFSISTSFDHIDTASFTLLSILSAANIWKRINKRAVSTAIHHRSRRYRGRSLHVCFAVNVSRNEPPRKQHFPRNGSSSKHSGSTFRGPLLFLLPIAGTSFNATRLTNRRINKLQIRGTIQRPRAPRSGSWRAQRI